MSLVVLQYDPRLQVLNHLKSLTRTKHRIEMTLCLITKTLKMISRTFCGPSKEICERNLKLLISRRMKCQKISDFDKFLINQLILYMKKVIIMKQKRSILCMNVMKWCKNIQLPKIRNLFNPFRKILKIQNSILCCVSNFVGNNYNKHIASRQTRKCLMQVPFKEGVHLINELYQTQNILSTTCFHYEASYLLVLFNRNKWILTESVHSRTISITYQVANKILKNILLCVDNSDDFCELLMAVIEFLVKLDCQVKLTKNQKCENVKRRKLGLKYLSDHAISRSRQKCDIIKSLSLCYFTNNKKRKEERTSVVWSIIRSIVDNYEKLKRRSLIGISSCIESRTQTTHKVNNNCDNLSEFSNPQCSSNKQFEQAMCKIKATESLLSSSNHSSSTDQFTSESSLNENCEIHSQPCCRSSAQSVEMSLDKLDNFRNRYATKRCCKRRHHSYCS